MLCPEIPAVSTSCAGKAKNGCRHQASSTDHLFHRQPHSAVEILRIPSVIVFVAFLATST